MQEFDVAFHHNIMVKRKKRLVVLMMLDSPSDLYDDEDDCDTATLRQFLRQYTYIDYTTDDWLDKLLYALPLRGLRALQNTQTTVNDAMESELHDDRHQDTDVLLLDPLHGEPQPHSSYEGDDVPMLQ